MSFIEEFIQETDRTIVRDRVTRLLILETAFSAYSDDPLNLFLRGPSSIGKTYVTMQTLKLFPQSDVMLLGGLSPTALVHDYGELVDPATGQPFDPYLEKPKKRDFKDNPEEYENALTEWREKIKRSYYRVELKNKILVFLEAPHPETFMRLRPILSHDAEEISYKFTDRPGGGPLRTVHVKLHGWPATIFCTTEERYLEDLATRSFTHTPEMHSDKYAEAVQLEGLKAAQPWLFESTPQTEQLRERLHLNIMASKAVRRVLIPYADKMAQVYGARLPRDMRDYRHFQALIKTSALLHIHERPQLIIDEKPYILATAADYELAKLLFQEIRETTQMGLGGPILRFYKLLKELWAERDPEEVGLSYGRVVEAYNQKAEEWGTQRVSKDRIYKWVKQLCEIGYLDTAPNPNDRRFRLIIVLENNGEISGDYRLPLISSFFTREDLEKWFSSLRNNSRAIIIYNNRWERREITVDELADIILYNINMERLLFSEAEKEDLSLFEEKKAEISGVQQYPLIPGKSPSPAISHADLYAKLKETITHLQRDVFLKKISFDLLHRYYFPDIPAEKLQRCIDAAVRDGWLIRFFDGSVSLKR